MTEPARAVADTREAAAAAEGAIVQRRSQDTQAALAKGRPPALAGYLQALAERALPTPEEAICGDLGDGSFEAATVEIAPEALMVLASAMHADFAAAAREQEERIAALEQALASAASGSAAGARAGEAGQGAGPSARHAREGAGQPAAPAAPVAEDVTDVGDPSVAREVASWALSLALGLLVGAAVVAVVLVVVAFATGITSASPALSWVGSLVVG